LTANWNFEAPSSDFESRFIDIFFMILFYKASILTAALAQRYANFNFLFAV